MAVKREDELNQIATPDLLTSNNGASGAPQYQESQAVADARAALESYNASKPQDYKSAYSSQIQSLLNDVLNRKQFSYDMNADPLYQQYKDQYVQQGQKAMRDVQGQSAALTGGYGNTYGVVASQQAYHDYLGQLNNKIPELYGMALDQYNTQGQQMVQNIGLLQGQDDAEYGRHRDSVGDYYNDMSNAMNQYNMYYGQDYDAYRDALAQYNADRAHGADEAYRAQQQANYDREWEYQLAQDAAKKKSSGGGSSSKPKMTDFITGMENTGSLELYGPDAMKAYLNEELRNGTMTEQTAGDIAAAYGLTAEEKKKASEKKMATGGGSANPYVKQ